MIQSFFLFLLCILLLPATAHTSDYTVGDFFHLAQKRRSSSPDISSNDPTPKNSPGKTCIDSDQEDDQELKQLLRETPAKTIPYSELKKFIAKKIDFAAPQEPTPEKKISAFTTPSLFTLRRTPRSVSAHPSTPALRATARVASLSSGLADMLLKEDATGTDDQENKPVVFDSARASVDSVTHMVTE